MLSALCIYLLAILPVWAVHMNVGLFMSLVGQDYHVSMYDVNSTLIIINLNLDLLNNITKIYLISIPFSAILG